MKCIAVIFADGRVSDAVGKSEKESKKIFNNYYGYNPPKDSYFAQVVMKITHKGETCSWQWVEKKDLLI